MSSVGLPFYLFLLFVDLPNFHLFFFLDVLYLEYLVFSIFHHLLDCSQVVLLLLPLDIPHLLVVEEYLVLSELPRRNRLRCCLKQRILPHW